MGKCKITVLETQFNEKLAKEYGVANIGPCPVHEVGQVFITDHFRPEDFCPEAWKSIQHYVFALVHGMKGTFFDNRWVRFEGVSINSCNDGLRPVIFKLEQLGD
ncbi:MAG: TIGR04076 family protein [Candidatus Lokiarchaeota archaeon]|nr:TIGR04076 family protein [Candidatus Lokiarchaeota archaeon]